MAILTEQIPASSLNLTDFVHIARPNDLSQSYNGSSYKATIAQLIDSENCCISSGVFSYESGALDLYGITGNLAFTVNGFTPFTGGSSNCINNLYLNNIHPCVTDIVFQPTSTTGRRTTFGENLGASGFSVVHIDQTDFNGQNFFLTKLGLNTLSINSVATFQFFSRNQESSLMFYDDLGGAVTLFRDVEEIVTLCENDDISQCFIVDAGGESMILGSVNNNDFGIREFGTPGETFISKTGNANGLNIVSTDSITDDSGYIRFFLGCDYASCGEDPHIHIDGDNPTKGFMGVGRNNINPTSLLDVNGTNADNITLGYQQLRLRNPYTVPKSNESVTPVGTLTWDDDYIYLKIAVNLWARGSLSAF